jgi:hypothetical protein
VLPWDPDSSPLYLLSRTHLAYVPDEMQARHPPPRLGGFGYWSSETTVTGVRAKSASAVSRVAAEAGYGHQNLKVTRGP